EYLTAGLASEDVVAYVEAHPAGFTKAVLALLVTNAEQALADGNRPLARTLFQIEEVLTTLNPVPLPAEPAGAPNVSQFVRQANDLFLGGDLAGARAALDQALQLAPDDAQLLLAQGNLALRQGDLAAARREFARAVTAAPGTAAPHLNLAAVLSLLNETAEAEAAAQRALAIQPEHPEAWKLLGQLHGQAQRWLDAGQCYSRALQAQPRDVEALVGLGVARWQAGDLAAAQTCCEQALAVDPTHAAARQLVARVQQAAQKPLNGAAPTHAAGRLSLAEVLAELEKLPSHWHAAGTLHIDVLRHIAQWAGGRAIQHTAETGTGKSTVLFSHLSPDHKVFAIDNGNTDSLPIVQGSSLLDHTHVEFILGPTQLTLPQHRFPHKLQIVLIDGPHGYPFPDLEYYYFYPWLDEGGLLIVDDIHIPTVRHMYEFIKADKMFRPAGMVHTTAFFERTTAPVFDPTGDGWWEQRYNKLHFPDRPMLVNIDLRRAKGRLAGGDLAGAREALLDLLELEPRHAEALSLLNTLRQPAN
ncbi:MAG: tetratricopeptide repeat protein, partial [Anaerolineales bacterium]|nr:tetratricopeptide repeat protein [Anaerolineales bacterium]